MKESTEERWECRIGVWIIKGPVRHSVINLRPRQGLHTQVHSTPQESDQIDCRFIAPIGTSKREGVQSFGSSELPQSSVHTLGGQLFSFTHSLRGFTRRNVTDITFVPPQKQFFGESEGLKAWHLTTLEIFGFLGLSKVENNLQGIS